MAEASDGEYRLHNPTSSVDMQSSIEQWTEGPEILEILRCHWTQGLLSLGRH
ncbi:hypothetical protein PISMIDRAFT_682652 [Pisolithus microcarpus 441]|uniref:Uncharacterized protein n=1 Tax=Pisolithus microcarpus 441 TaxID=765257 RepID=A0A0C9ZJA8_9AGAM|nr:hypothetical protein PISMIDRAFT_682652 [Pisolithus microcarpus 441]